MRAFSAIRSWSEYITMRDGVRLAADIYLPKGLQAEERTATILHMSRYYRSVDLRGLWKPFLGFGAYALTERDIRERFVKAGYSWVDVDVRGSGASFGRQEYPLSSNEVGDGADIVDWIIHQPWSAGAVGATGSSYDGVAASLLVRNRHPAVKAVIPRFSAWDLYEDIFLPGGLQANGLLQDWAQLTKAFDTGRLTDVFGWMAGLVARGVRPVDDRLLPLAMAEHKSNIDLEQVFGQIVYRDDTDPWGRGLTVDDVSPHTLDGEAAAVPIYAYGGWFDGALARGQIRQYLTSDSPGSRLILGPWFHGGDFNASPYANGRNNDFDHAGEMIRFFDYHLRGVDNRFSGQLPVRYYTMGSERWSSSSVWPPPGAEWQALNFARRQTLTTVGPAEAGHYDSGPANRLRPDSAQGASSGKQGYGGQEAGHYEREIAPSEVAGDECATDIYNVDSTVTSGPGSRWGLIVGTGRKRGYSDRRDVDRRLLTYTTAPLERDVEVTGHPIVRVFLSANAIDGAIFAYLEDVHPSGEVRYVTEGQLRLLHRQVAQARLKPGTTTDLPPQRGRHEEARLTGFAPTPLKEFRRTSQASAVEKPGTTNAVSTPMDLLPFSRTYRRADAHPLTPGQITEVVFDLLPTSFRFPAGHAIRLAIAGADAGVFDVPLPASPVIYQIHRDSQHASRLELPTYPGSKPLTAR